MTPGSTEARHGLSKRWVSSLDVLPYQRHVPEGALANCEKRNDLVMVASLE